MISAINKPRKTCPWWRPHRWGNHYRELRKSSFKSLYAVYLVSECLDCEKKISEGPAEFTRKGTS
jgi:hypothetical protein